jgi:ABC-type dipeptide/oligopeptide/nickel transport system permease subunit
MRIDREKDKLWISIWILGILFIWSSIPQIIGILVGYILLTILIQYERVETDFSKIFLMAFILSLFIFLEIYDLFTERINHFKKLDFFDAMRVCGIRESRIINREILLRSSFVHLLNKLIAIFGMAIFLQCSIDFIISVGLSTDISSVNLPVTLGSLLAKIDSKQDILAIGYSISHWNYIGKIFFEHLQGVTVASLIVFSLLCIYQISNGYAKRYRL